MVKRNKLPDQKSITLAIQGNNYRIDVLQRVQLPPEHARLVVVAYQPNELARQILRLCLASIQRFTPEPHELWVVDNLTPQANLRWLLKEENVNLVLNHTAPIPPGKRTFINRLPLFYSQQNWGSYANAIGLELAARLIHPESRHLVTLHMDSLPCHPDWLRFLRSKVQGDCAAAGVFSSHHRVPQGALHVLGSVFDFRRLSLLRLTFLPDLPRYDTGDLVTVGLRQAGYRVYTCPNSLQQPELVECIPAHSPLRQFSVFRAFDEAGNVIFLHLGRGLRKTTGQHRKGVTAQEWVQFAQANILA